MKKRSVCNASSENEAALSDAETTRKLLLETPCSSVYPKTPLKHAAHRIDCTTPRNRYCSHLKEPPTPEPTPRKSVKRSAGHAFETSSDYLSSTKRRHTDPEALSKTSPLFRRCSVPTFSILYQPPSLEPLNFSADELKRTCEAMLQQVNWDEVQEFVASNRSAGAYRKALKRILQAEVDKLFQAEDDEESSD